MTNYELISTRYTHWKEHRHDKFKCSTCGLIIEFTDGHTGQYIYCPQCGEEIVYVVRYGDELHD
jgi:predicted RNA-binding Zn-ribbon protein involved in translation (DUF1610 family)